MFVINSLLNITFDKACFECMKYEVMREFIIISEHNRSYQEEVEMIVMKNTSWGYWTSWNNSLNGSF